MKVMLNVQLQRKREQGKETTFYLHGRPVPHQKLDRYVRRKGMSEADIMSYNMRESHPIKAHSPPGNELDRQLTVSYTALPSYITCHTPTYEAAPQTGESSSSGGAGQYNTAPTYTTAAYYPTYYSSY